MKVEYFNGGFTNNSQTKHEFMAVIPLSEETETRAGEILKISEFLAGYLIDQYNLKFAYAPVGQKENLSAHIFSEHHIISRLKRKIDAGEL